MCNVFYCILHITHYPLPILHFFDGCHRIYPIHSNPHPNLVVRGNVRLEPKLKIPTLDLPLKGPLLFQVSKEHTKEKGGGGDRLIIPINKM